MAWLSAALLLLLLLLLDVVEPPLPSAVSKLWKLCCSADFTESLELAVLVLAVVLALVLSVELPDVVLELDALNSAIRLLRSDSRLPGPPGPPPGGGGGRLPDAAATLLELVSDAVLESDDVLESLLCPEPDLFWACSAANSCCMKLPKAWPASWLVVPVDAVSLVLEVEVEASLMPSWESAAEMASSILPPLGGRFDSTWLLEVVLSLFLLLQLWLNCDRAVLALEMLLMLISFSFLNSLYGDAGNRTGTARHAFEFQDWSSFLHQASCIKYIGGIDEKLPLGM